MLSIKVRISDWQFCKWEWSWTSRSEKLKDDSFSIILIWRFISANNILLRALTPQSPRKSWHLEKDKDDALWLTTGSSGVGGKGLPLFLVTIPFMFLFLKFGWWRASLTSTVKLKALSVGTNTQYILRGEDSWAQLDGTGCFDDW